MGDAVEGALGYALGIAASPIPIVAVIVMIFSTRPRLNSVVFTSTWVAGIAVVAFVVAIAPGLEFDDDAPGTTRSLVRLGVGVVFLLLAVRNWRRRPGPDDEPTLPRWMEVEDRVGPATAIGLGLVLSILNPKDVTLAAAGGAAIGGEQLGVSETAAAVVVFTAIAASTVVIPVVAYLIVGARLDGTLESTKEWLVRHNAVVLTVIWAILGASFAVDAISTLAS